MNIDNLLCLTTPQPVHPVILIVTSSLHSDLVRGCCSVCVNTDVHIRMASTEPGMVDQDCPRTLQVAPKQFLRSEDACRHADACDLSPARDASVITVAAITSADVMPSYSDGGVCVDLLGPGSLVLSAYYGSDTGTA